MILLLGGTSETAPVAQALAAAGPRVLVSTATDIPLEIGKHDRIARRCGRLDGPVMAELIRREHIRLLVDATHPYAVKARVTAEQAAREAGIPYLTYLRPSACSRSEGMSWEPTSTAGQAGALTVPQGAGDSPPYRDELVVSTHDEAARFACARNRPVLLTVGSRNVAVYAQEAARTGVDLIVRVLDCQESISACRTAGIPAERIVTGRGPFSVDENRALIRRFHIGVVVTKDSGEAGGFSAKAEAARLESCQLIVVGRPPRQTGLVFEDQAALVSAALKFISQQE